MDRVRLSISFFLFLCNAASFAQHDSVSLERFSVGAGFQLTQTMLSTPAVACQFKVKYNIAEVSLRYGRNKASIQNIRQFDELQLSGEWVEVNLAAVLPLYPGGSDRIEGIRLGAGIGLSNTKTEYKEIFEALPPYEDFIYVENYETRKQKFASFSLGYVVYPHRNFELGFGCVGFLMIDKPVLPITTVITPFKARSPIGLYTELCYVL
jgi:hypothetical protein